VLEFDFCSVLRRDRRVCVRGVDAALVEKRRLREVPEYVLLFVRCNIPKRVGLVRSATLQTSIHGMLERIPSIYPKGLDYYFRSIDSKLSAYEAKLSA